MMDIAQAVLQRGEGTPTRTIAAFQEIVSDLYDGFLSVEDRSGIEPPDLATAAAMIKFGNPAFGPYTQLGVALTMAKPLAVDLAGGFFTAHLVAAAATTALQKGANIPMLFGRMLDLLKAMHEKNPPFGPLVVRHPGDLARDRMSIPQPAVPAVPGAPTEAVAGV